MRPLTTLDLKVIKKLPFVKNAWEVKQCLKVTYKGTKLCFSRFETTNGGKSMGPRWIYLPEQTITFYGSNNIIKINCPVRQPHAFTTPTLKTWTPCMGDGSQLLNNERRNNNWKGLVWIMWIWIHSKVDSGMENPHYFQVGAIKNGYPIWDKDKKRVPTDGKSILKMIKNKELLNFSGFELERLENKKKFKSLKFDEVL